MEAIKQFIDEELNCIADIESKPNGIIRCWWIDDDKGDYKDAERSFGGKILSDYDGEAWYGLEWTVNEIFYMMEDLKQRRAKAGYKPYRRNGFLKFHYQDWDNRKWYQKE